MTPCMRVMETADATRIVREGAAPDGTDGPDTITVRGLAVYIERSPEESSSSRRGTAAALVWDNDE